ncbi:MAG: ABC transporter ATP-binding protein [Bacillota bacterium]|nr:ABC transporter ATP-binding protein [Bacillota bacterium]
MKTAIRLAGFLRPYLLMVLGSLALVIVVSGLGIAQPLVIRWTIDTVLMGKRYNLLPLAAGAVIAIAVVRGLLTFGQRYSMEYIGQKAVFDIRNRLYFHMQQLSFSFYDKAQTGQLMSRLVSDVNTVQRFLGMGLINITSNAFTLLAVLVILLRLDWRLTIVSMSVIPFLLHAVFTFSKKVRPLFWSVQDQMAILTTDLQESLTGIKVVKAFAREDYELQKFDRENKEYMDRNLKSVRMTAFYGPYMNFLSGIAATLILWYGGREVIGKALTLGSLVAFNSYLLQLMHPIRMLGMLVGLVQRGISSGDRIFDILDTKADVADRPGARELPPVKGEVVLDNVWFSYDKKTPVLEGVTLRAPAGSTIAILGATGSGKSTVIHLIPRFYDVDEGRVLIDGRDIRDVTLDSLRRQIGIVTQETFLFSASIKDNIAYGRPEATDQEIVAAARAAHIHDFIASLPQGYNTVIGERGVGLSGGQKQRVAIARALLMDARIVLLDESTSNVDVETEMQIQKAFSDLLRDRTSFIIAQRLSTVRTADKIIVLDKGKAAEEGTHDELLNLGGVYAQIYEMQFRSQEGVEGEHALQGEHARAAAQPGNGPGEQVREHAHARREGGEPQ